MTVHFLSQHRIRVPGHTLSGRSMSAVFLALCPMESDNAGGGARAWALTAETPCPPLATWARWEGLSGGAGWGVRTWSEKGQKANWKPGLVEHCPSQTEEQEASPMGLLRTKSLSGMNVLLCKVLVCPEADCEVEGPQKSQPWNHRSSEPGPGRVPGAPRPSGSGFERCKQPST